MGGDGWARVQYHRRIMTDSSDSPFIPDAASGGGGADSVSISGSASVAVNRESIFSSSDSPCVAICSTLYDEICRGCGRTAMEVANWVFLSEEEKQAVWVRIKSQGYPRR